MPEKLLWLSELPRFVQNPYFLFDFSYCTHLCVLVCDCSEVGSESLQCDNNGECNCKPGFKGPKCDECSPEFEGDKCEECAPTFYGYPDCTSCECNEQGSKGKTCDTQGKCTCDNNVTGDKCSFCSEGHYSFPQCLGKK